VSVRWHSADRSLPIASVGGASRRGKEIIAGSVHAHVRAEKQIKKNYNSYRSESTVKRLCFCRHRWVPERISRPPLFLLWWQLANSWEATRPRMMIILSSPPSLVHNIWMRNADARLSEILLTDASHSPDVWTVQCNALHYLTPASSLSVPLVSLSTGFCLVSFSRTPPASLLFSFSLFHSFFWLLWRTPLGWNHSRIGVNNAVCHACGSSFLFLAFLMKSDLTGYEPMRLLVCHQVLLSNRSHIFFILLQWCHRSSNVNEQVNCSGSGWFDSIESNRNWTEPKASRFTMNLINTTGPLRPIFRHILVYIRFISQYYSINIRFISQYYSINIRFTSQYYNLNIRDLFLNITTLTSEIYFSILQP
jgi:hypothetical protein